MTDLLVGLRTNEPAKNYYFVPGGVIRKNETIELAFERILKAETGCRARMCTHKSTTVRQSLIDVRLASISGAEADIS